jgi:flagellar biosynthesis GTPase FlhF
MDESATLGTVFSEAALAGLALSFLSNGSRIPDDIRATKVEDLLAMVQEPSARAQVGSTKAA